MIETLEQQNAVRRVIQHILDEKPFADLTDEEKRLAKECVDKKYIDGFELLEMATGRIVMECRCKPFLTEAGAAFLSGDNSHPIE